MVGWFLNLPALTSIIPQWVTMKFSTALSFFVSGISLFFIAKMAEGHKSTAQAVLPITSLIILLLMATLLVSVIVGVRTGIEDLFVREAKGAIRTVTPGRPSLGTMIDFTLLGIAGIVALFEPANHRKYLTWMGWIITVMGVVAIFGYIFDNPTLYYTISAWSTAMALHTAILFTLLGIALILLSRKFQSNNK